MENPTPKPRGGAKQPVGPEPELDTPETPYDTEFTITQDGNRTVAGADEAPDITIESVISVTIGEEIVILDLSQAERLHAGLGVHLGLPSMLPEAEAAE